MNFAIGVVIDTPVRPPEEKMSPLELDSVSFHPAGRRILDRVSLNLGNCPITALIGPNGAGKTVTLRIAHGLLAPHGGRVRFEGRESNGSDSAFEGQAMVFQQSNVLRGTVLQNLHLARHAAGLARDEFDARADDMLGRTDLRGLSHAPATKLSGGERQRLAIARAWIVKPRMLLLDEPTASLDPSARDRIEALIREIADSGCRVVMTSHNLGQVARLAQEVVLMTAGCIAEHAPSDEFFRAPRTHAAQAFLKGELPWL